MRAKCGNFEMIGRFMRLLWRRNGIFSQAHKEPVFHSNCPEFFAVLLKFIDLGVEEKIGGIMEDNKDEKKRRPLGRRLMFLQTEIMSPAHEL
jgi:hypothetical protein